MALQEDEDEVESLQYKVILLGDGTVGKTSVAVRFTDDSFGKEYKQTIGLDFFIKRIILPGDVQVALQIWDIGGQTIGSKMVSNYIFGAQAIILMYDITNYQSFQDLEDWLAIIKKTFASEPLPYIALVGNKTDLGHLRIVKHEKHNQFAEENRMFSFFVSAKTGDNIASCFYRISADLAGVTLSKPELEVATRVIKAEVVNHPKALDAGEQPQKQLSEKKSCLIQ